MTINGTEVVGITINGVAATSLSINGQTMWEETPVVPDTELCIENTSASSGTFTAYKWWNTNEVYIDLWYSLDDGETWTDLGLNVMSRAGDSGGDITKTVTVPANGKLYLRGDNANGVSDSGQYVKFGMDTAHNVSGNILSLIDADDYATITPTLTKGFYWLFRNDADLVSAGSLKIPLSTLPSYGCYGMFQNCTALTTPPDMSSVTSVGSNSCYLMFSGCTALTTTPDMTRVTTIGVTGCAKMFRNCSTLATVTDMLSVASIDNYGCMEMFSRCTSLVTPPEIPSYTTVSSYNVFIQMFDGCSALATAPDLSNITSVQMAGFEQMFNNCVNLSYVKCPSISTWDTSFFTNWLNGAGSQATGTKTVYKPSALTIPTDNNSGIPTGWTAVDY